MKGRKVWRVLDLHFDIGDHVAGLNVESDTATKFGLDVDLHATAFVFELAFDFAKNACVLFRAHPIGLGGLQRQHKQRQQKLHCSRCCKLQLTNNRLNLQVVWEKILRS